MGTVVVLAILAGVVALIVRKMIKDKKNAFCSIKSFINRASCFAA